MVVQGHPKPRIPLMGIPYNIGNWFWYLEFDFRTFAFLPNRIGIII